MQDDDKCYRCKGTQDCDLNFVGGKWLCDECKHHFYKKETTQHRVKRERQEEKEHDALVKKAAKARSQWAALLERNKELIAKQDAYNNKQRLLRGAHYGGDASKINEAWALYPNHPPITLV
jgi:hypothetical protein